MQTFSTRSLMPPILDTMHSSQSFGTAEYRKERWCYSYGIQLGVEPTWPLAQSDRHMPLLICANKWLWNMYSKVYQEVQNSCCVKYKNISNHSHNILYAVSFSDAFMCWVKVKTQSYSIIRVLWNMLLHSNSMTLHWQHQLATSLILYSMYTKHYI